MVQRNLLLAGVLSLALASSACRSSGWNEPVRTWGTMRAVMHDGRTEGKVRVADAVAAPHAVGIGALAGLSGEIVILDGNVWTSRVIDAPRIETAKVVKPADEAALLAVTQVSRWSEHTLEHDLSAVDLDDRLRALADETGLPRVQTFPFVIRGELDELDAHVLNGRCPYVGSGPENTDPVRTPRAHANGTLIGFYTELEAGLLTHHGSRTHVHVLIEGAAPFVGHVDSVRIRQGARICLPQAP